MYAVIDIAEPWPGQQAAYPRSVLEYSRTGGQVVGVVLTYDAACELLKDSQDRSGLQRLRIVDLGAVPLCVECGQPTASAIRCPACDTHRCWTCMRLHTCG